MSDSAPILRFDVFELDTAAGELRRRGDRVKLPPQPFRVLELLVRRGGEVLTRADIRERIWSDSFVDFEQGLNFCIRQIREALGDTAEAPRFIETLPRRGYRFLLPVETPPPAEPKAIRSLIVLPFRMLRPDPGTDFLAFSLPEALTTSLSGLKSLVVRSSLAASRFADGTQDLKTIAAEAHVDLIVTGTLLSTGDEIRVTAQLTDAATGTLMCSLSTQTSIGSVFRLQDELTECLVDALSLELTSREQRITQHCGERDQVRADVAVADGAVVIFVGVGAFDTCFENHRHIRTRPVFGSFVVLGGRAVFTKTHPGAESLGMAFVTHELFSHVMVPAKIPVQTIELSLLPHLFPPVPTQHPVPDVVGRYNGANLPRAIPGQAAGMATIEDRVKLRRVRKRRVVLKEIVISDGTVLGPMEIVRDQAFIHVIGDFRGIVIGKLRAVAAVIEDAFLFVGGAIQKPVDPFPNGRSCGAFIEHDPDILRIESHLLEDAAHQEHIVDAAIQP
jgi:DNA-binding winged helix-turn-helix (wHTH) protein